MLYGRIHDLLEYHGPMIGYQDVDRETRERIRENWTWLELLQKLNARGIIPIIGPFCKRPGPLYWHETKTHKFDLICPFHAEKTPSLRGWPSGWFYCHGCQAQGDYFDFALAYLGESVCSALEFLANSLELDPNQGTLLVSDPILRS